MKITVIGAGAIGCLFGGFLKKAGADVSFLEKDEKKVNKINRKGIVIEGITGIHSIKNVFATSNPKDIKNCDLILIAVKAYDTLSALPSIKQILEPSTAILTIQNGIGNTEILLDNFEKFHVMAGVTTEGATVLDDGDILYAGIGETTLGTYAQGQVKKLKKFVALLNFSGLKASITDNIEGYIWNKLIINCGINALASILRVKNGRLLETNESRKILRSAAAEVVMVARKKYIDLPFDDYTKKTEQICRKTADNTNSMLQDLAKGRKTEINYLNGAVVMEGKKVKVLTPVNELLTNLILSLENINSSNS